MTTEDTCVDIFRQCIQRTNEIGRKWSKERNPSSQISKEEIKGVFIHEFTKRFLSQPTSGFGTLHPIYNDKVCKQITKSIIWVNYSTQVTSVTIHNHRSVYGHAEHILEELKRYKIELEEDYIFEEFQSLDESEIMKEEPIKAFLEFSF